MRSALVSFGFAAATAMAVPLFAAPGAPPARFEHCTIVNGETKSCAGFTDGEVIFSNAHDSKPQAKNPMLHRCQCARGLIRKCQSVPFDGWTVRQNPTDDKYYECKAEAGVVGECKKKPYSGEADLVICVAANCSPPFPPTQD